MNKGQYIFLEHSTYYCPQLINTLTCSFLVICQIEELLSPNLCFNQRLCLFSLPAH